jgi:hypothetical protein
VLRAAVTNAMTQGVNMVVGNQHKFDWKGVAAAGAGGAMSQWASEKLDLQNPAALKGMDAFEKMARSSLVGFAAGATTAVMHGGRLDVVQVATDAFGNAVANSIAQQVQPRAKIAQTKDYENNLPELDKIQLRQDGTFATSKDKLNAVDATDVSRDLQASVMKSDRFSLMGRVAGWLGLVDSPSQIGVTVAMPDSAPDNIKAMYDPKTGSLLPGYHLSDLSAAARSADLPIDVQVNGIKNSVSQATSNSVSMGMEQQALGRNSIVISAYNPTNGEVLDGVESALIKAGTNTATVEATRQLIEFANEHNTGLVEKGGNENLGFTKVWGHSEGSIIATQALLEGVSEKVRGNIDLNVFGTATGAAPEGLHTYLSVRNEYDFVAANAGHILTNTNGVENSKGFIEGNNANPGSYRSVTTSFVVVDPANGARIEADQNHSWQYYMQDGETRSAMGLAPMTDDLKRIYSRSPWLKKE